MSFTYDPTTDLGFVRLTISDTEDTNRDGDSGYSVFSDEELTALLDRNGGSALQASAAALRAMAGSAARLAKRISLGNITTDTTTAAKELRALASDIEAKALSDLEDAPLSLVVSPSWTLDAYEKNVAAGRTD